eukprot:6466219-Amphidinium_carterae.1
MVTQPKKRKVNTSAASSNDLEDERWDEMISSASNSSGAQPAEALSDDGTAPSSDTESEAPEHNIWEVVAKRCDEWEAHKLAAQSDIRIGRQGGNWSMKRKGAEVAEVQADVLPGTALLQRLPSLRTNNRNQHESEPCPLVQLQRSSLFLLEQRHARQPAEKKGGRPKKDNNIATQVARSIKDNFSTLTHEEVYVKLDPATGLTLEQRLTRDKERNEEEKGSVPFGAPYYQNLRNIHMSEMRVEKQFHVEEGQKPRFGAQEAFVAAISHPPNRSKTIAWLSSHSVPAQ